MNRRDSTGRFTRTGTALAVRDPWIDAWPPERPVISDTAWRAGWLIISAKAVGQPPQFGLDTAEDRKFLAEITVQNFMLAAENAERAERVLQEENARLDAYQARRPAITPRPALAAAPSLPELTADEKKHMAAIEAAWDEDHGDDGAWRLLDEGEK